ncbi:hypothetical protein KW800_01620 [Candidatus Parcubacteria bacterium]|nr:hypothetical protein [Candidatus Parcubacteria bacterium]
MIQVHNTFVCKPGNASKIAKLMKTMPFDPVKGPYILTDMTGQWHRVIMIHNYNNLAEFEEAMRKEMEKDYSEVSKEEQDKWKDMNDMYVSGGREIYKVW